LKALIKNNFRTFIFNHLVKKQSNMINIDNMQVLLYNYNKDMRRDYTRFMVETEYFCSLFNAQVL